MILRGFLVNRWRRARAFQKQSGMALTLGRPPVQTGFTLRTYFPIGPGLFLTEWPWTSFPKNLNAGVITCSWELSTPVFL